jgi:hypothetical protein
VGPTKAGDAATTAERIVPRRRPEHLGTLHVTQFLIAEAVVVAILIALGRGARVAVIVALFGLAVLAVTLGRRHGRWLAQTRVLAWRFRRRQQSATAALTWRRGSSSRTSRSLTVPGSAWPETTPAGPPRSPSVRAVRPSRWMPSPARWSTPSSRVPCYRS